MGKDNLFFGFAGRLGRKAYWFAMAMLPLIAAGCFAIIDPFDIDTVLSGKVEEIEALLWDPFVLAIAGVALWGFAAVHAKRLHDRDRTAWRLVAPALLLGAGLAAWRWPAQEFVLVVCAAAAAIGLPVTLWLFVEAGFLAGSADANRFGPAPEPMQFKWPQKLDWGKFAGDALRAVLLSPVGILIVLPLQLIGLLLLPFRRRHVFFGIDGRIGRGRFWGLMGTTFLLAILFDILPIYAGAYLSGRDYNELEASPTLKPFHLLIIGLAAWSLTAIGGKRLHDRNYSAWWIAAFSPFLAVALGALLGSNPTVDAILGMLLLISLPAVLWFLLQLGFLKGIAGPNRFGPDPLSPPPQ